MTSRYIEDSASSTAISAFVVGIVGNAYGRFRNRLALVPILPSILCLLPGSVALMGTSAFIDSDISNGTKFVFQVVQVALSITVGLFVANMIVFPIKKGNISF